MLPTLCFGEELYFASKQVILIFGVSGFPHIYIVQHFIWLCAVL